jgi:hypothetical protein
MSIAIALKATTRAEAGQRLKTSSIDSFRLSQWQARQTEAKANVPHWSKPGRVDSPDPNPIIA